MSRSYEELMGSLGRGIYFRPERSRVRDLLSRDAHPKLVVGQREFPVFDISMNGLSFLSPEDAEAWTVGDEVPVCLSLHGKEVHAGTARIARVEAGPRGGARIGLGLVTGFLDLPEIRRQDEEARLAGDLEAGPRPAYDAIPHDYLHAVSRAVHFLQYYRRSLDRHEARYRAEGGAAAHDRVAALAESALAAVRGPWNDIKHEATLAAHEALGDRETLLAAKEYTETVVTSLMLEAPLMWRAYTKPLGYPGDYQVMLYYYDNALTGSSVFGRVFHKLGVEHPLSAGVRTRKEFVVDLMEREHQRLLEEHGDRLEYRVASLGSGPAREVSDYVARRKGWPGRVVWTLVDQEDEALSVAYHSGQREIARHGARGALRCLNVSFIQLLSEPSVMPLEQPQHFIFSTGLVDYLRESRAQELVHALYDRLLPGGLLAVGNALGPNEHFWSPEFVLDWTLLYRSREEMLRLAAHLPDTSEVEVAREPGNAYYFLLVRKR